MLTKIFKIQFLSFFFMGIFLTSCEKDVISVELTSENAEKAAQIDVASDEVDALIDEAYLLQEGMNVRSVEMTGNYMPSCVTKTVVINDTFKTITLDFGSGCVLPNGNRLSGIIKIVYEHNLTQLSKSIKYTFENFTFNDIGLIGGGNIVRVLKNENNNPQSTAIFDVTATFPDNRSAHRTGTKIREWILGFDNRVWQDNVFLITGNWATEYRNGDIYKGLVKTPLRREATCPFFVSGIIELSHNESIAQIDFGDGTCDNLALFINSKGEEHIIKLKR